MTRRYALAQLMALPLNPAQMIQLAADTGCSAVGIRLLPTAPGGIHHPLMHDAAGRREALAAMRDTGVRVLDLEVARIDTDFDVGRFEPFLACGAELGAAHVLVAGDDPDEARLSASFAAFCAAAARHGLSANLEFMPWTAVPSLGVAQRIVQTVDQPNAAVLVDALHFARSPSNLDDLAGWPRQRLNYAQICDGLVPGPSTVAGLIHDARCERLLPGEGGIDLVELFARLPADLPISIEVPSESRSAALGHKAWARLAIAATDPVLAAADARRAQRSAAQAQPGG
ncbi:sugar phosphate isomerase/epimerase family protein [Sphaerotilus mobilis]|uniref:Sugar phosphate isomerase/epimerase n=1 Tax=Sphaerotilus mobilis TaxID=47994 RepID=A0A4V2EX18_9BURK|nr:TIM barrel protein [Sphaerotilus mobilis]RZS57940.1 sugar phosphate isomerase/epimerase [Sphaerotilus mobilis]